MLTAKGSTIKLPQVPGIKCIKITAGVLYMIVIHRHTHRDIERNWGPMHILKYLTHHHHHEKLGINIKIKRTTIDNPA